MKQKTLSEREILEIDGCASSIGELPGVLQVYAGYGRSMQRLPDINRDGSLVILMDVAGSFVKRCFDAFDVQKIPHESGMTNPRLDKIEKIDRKSALGLSKRSVFRIKIFKVGSLLSSKYRVVLQICVGGSILKFAEYYAPSVSEIFAIAKRTLR